MMEICSYMHYSYRAIRVILWGPEAKHAESRFHACTCIIASYMYIYIAIEYIFTLLSVDTLIIISKNQKFI